ncbi:MAG: DUF2232 domain-containing protein, partial [Ghiorsea sp.]
MSQEPTPNVQAMPKMLELFLTNRLPCALLVVLMLTSVYWFNVLFGNVPVVGFLMLLLGSVLMMSVPIVFALVLFGGGLNFTMQVAGIVALAVFILSSGSLNLALAILLSCAVIPVFSALRMQREDGFHQSAWSLAVGLLVFTFIAMWFTSDAGIKDWMQQMLAPMFDDMLASVPVGETEVLLSIQSLRDVMVMIFPGLMVFSLWLTWWGNILFARKLAKKYGFYRGDECSMLYFRLPTKLVYALLVLLALTNMASGDIQYVAMNTLLVLAGLIAVQGIAVA